MLNQPTLLLVSCFTSIVAALPSCSFKRSVVVTITCDVSQQNVTSLQWQMGGILSEMYPSLTTCDLHGCDDQSYQEFHTFLATVQLDLNATHIVSSSLKLLGYQFFSFSIGDYGCVPDGGQAVRICDNLTFFEDPTPPVCGSPTVADDEVKIKCTIENVYPAPQCRLNIASDGQIRNITTTIVEQSRMVVNPDYMSYSANCIVSIPLSELGVGNHVFQLVASANFNDSELADVYSNNVSFTVSSSPEKPKCLYPVINMTTKAIIVECYTSFVYPALVCQLETFKNNIPLVVPANVTYINDMALYQADIILVSKCIHSVPLHNIGPGFFEFKVTMYNVINGTETNGTRVTGDFTSPLLLKNPIAKILSKILCDDNFRSTRYWASCTCQLQVVGNPRGSIEWHSSDGIVYKRSNIKVDFDDYRANRTFTCHAKTPIEDNLPGVTWALIWQVPAAIQSFNADCEGPITDFEGQFIYERILQFAADVNSSVTLDCQPEGTPLPKVVITKLGSDVPLPTNGTSFVIQIADCTDTSGYRCQVLNSTGSAVDFKTMYILVKCPFQLLNKSVQPITQSKSGETVYLHFQFSGYPKLKMISITKRAVNGPNQRLSYRDFDYNMQRTGINIIDIWLTLKPVSETTNYTLTLENGIRQLTDVNFSIYIEAGTSDVNIGAIVGGVVGGILAIVILVVLSYCILGGRRNSRSHQEVGANVQIVKTVTRRASVNERL